MSDRLTIPSLNFAGGSRLDCQNYIRDVRREALALGRERDDQWLADFAASGLTGDALDWHFELDEETQESWKLLQRAMLARFRGESGDNITSGSNSPAAFSPTPAAARQPVSPSPTNPFQQPALAAAAGPPAPPIATPTRPLNWEPEIGWIMVHEQGAVQQRWISRTMAYHGTVTTTTERSEALVVRFDRSVRPLRIHMVNTFSGYGWLAIASSTTRDAYPMHPYVRPGAITKVFPNQDLLSFSSEYAWHVGAVDPDVWIIDVSNSIMAVHPGTTSRTMFFINSGSGNLYSGSNLRQYQDFFPESDSHAVTLQFIPRPKK